MVRGIAILTIVINHLGQVVEHGGLTRGLIPTPTRYGYSTAAELFVFLSGYMVGLVYLSRPRPMRAILHRAWTLWLYYLALLAIVLPLAAAMTSAELDFWHLDTFLNEPVRAAFEFLTLQRAPRLLDILQLYIILMLTAPIAIAIHQRWPRAMVAISVSLYVIAQVLVFLRVSADPDATDDGLLKLLSWQALFFVPMALGAARAHLPLFRWLEGRWLPFVVLAALLIATGVARYLQDIGTLARPDWPQPRHGLHPLRLGHALVVLLFYASVLTLARRYLDIAPMRAIAAVGRHSLDCFVFGVVATYALGWLWSRAGGGPGVYYLLAALAVVATLIVARQRDGAKSRKSAGR